MMEHICPWALSHPLLRTYHDLEWGTPYTEENLLFEFLILEGVQAGLSWLTVLKKREHYRRAYQGFEVETVARFDDRTTQRLLADKGLIRNRAKIKASITNARAMLNLREQNDSFYQFLRNFCRGLLPRHEWRNSEQIPTTVPLAERLSKELKKRGFSFVGPVIIYSFMQAIGLVNDHLISCPRYNEVEKLRIRIWLS